MDVIAEHRLAVLFPDADPSPVCLRIGRPAPHPSGNYVCLVQADGLRVWEGPTEIVGVDSWHALVLALRFMRSVLLAEVQKGAVFQWEGSGREVSVEDLFVLGESE